MDLLIFHGFPYKIKGFRWISSLRRRGEVANLRKTFDFTRKIMKKHVKSRGPFCIRDKMKNNGRKKF